MATNGITNAIRTAAVRGWVKETYDQGVRVQGITTKRAAVAATVALGFVVTTTRLAREFDRLGISFRRGPEDPPPPAWSKSELLRSRVATLEQKVAALEAAAGKKR